MSNEEKKNEKNTEVDATVNQEDNGFIEELKENIKEPKKSFLKRSILLLFMLSIFGGVGFLLYTLQIKSNVASVKLEPREIDYTQIINNWNKQVQKNTPKRDFLLTRESNDEMMVQLENWMKNFYIPKTTDSLEYNQFLENNKFGKPTYFDSSMSKDKVRELLKKATKEKVMAKIVKKVLMMNDIELWEKLRK